MPRTYLPLILLLFFYGGLFAQNYNYSHYTIKDGLAGLIVHGSCQDKDGFIWFATETGLSRFDGQQFRNFTIADGLPSNEIFFMIVDSKNRIWICTFTNTICFYYKGKVYNQENHPGLHELHLKNPVVDVYETKYGDIILKDHGGNYVAMDADCHVKPVTDPEKEKLRICKIIADEIQPIPGSVKSFIRGQNDPRLFQAESWRRDTLNGQYLFSARDSLIFLDPAHKLYYVKYNPDLLYTFLFGKNRILESSYSGHTYLYDVIEKKYIDEYLPGNIIQFVLKDVEGNFWFSTRGNGVFKLGRPTITGYTFGESQVPLAVHNIIKKEDGLFVITDNAYLWKMVPARGKQSNMLPFYQKVQVKGKVSWLANLPDGFFMNYQTDFLHMLTAGHTGKGRDKSICIYNDTLLKATSGEALIYTLPDLKKIKRIHIGRSTCAYKKADKFFIGALNGVYLYDNNGNHYAKILNNRISTFAEGENGILWISTYDNGVFGYKNNRIICNINKEKNGLNSNICRCLFVAKGALWIGTEKGLNKVSTINDDYRVVATYSTHDGLDNDMINSIFIDDKVVYVGTQGGLNIFNESNAPGNSICNIKLTDIIVSGVNRSVGDVLKLHHRDNNVRFEFSGISFLSQGQITYKYRMLGLSDDWHNTKEQAVEYLTLPSGKYTFQIKAINKFNNESEVVEQNIEIEPLFWEQRTFQAGVIVVLLLLVAVIFRSRIASVKRKESIKRSMNQKMMELEQMALRSQMNPHFIFNCINSIQNYILNQDAKGANHYLSQFAGLIRQTLENAPKAYISMAEEIMYIRHYIELEKLQSGNAFDYKMDIDPSININDAQIPNMVIQPYVENAIKHGLDAASDRGMLLIKFCLQHDKKILACIIQDNGPGINTRQMHSHTHKPKGMSITRKRIDILNQLAHTGRDIGLIIEDMGTIHKHSTGTRITIRFPLQTTGAYSSADIVD